MEIVHRGFDALDVAFQGTLSRDTLRALASAKERAGSSGGAEYTEIGGIGVWVKETGAQGGYAYQFDTGPDGEIWIIKNNSDPLQWNMRVSVRAIALAVDGYQVVKDRLFERMAKWGGRVLGEGISRVDFAVDIIAPDFVLDPQNLVAHSRCEISENSELEDIPSGGTGIQVRGVSGRRHYVRIGEMPGRSVVIYDKRREAVMKRKSQWFDIWERDKADCPPVWRVEVRAGKDHLRAWGIRTFEDLERDIGTVFAAALSNVRMVKHRDVTNITRAEVSDFWKLAADTISAAVEDMKGDAVYGRIVEGRRSDIQDIYREQIIGLAVSYAFARGRSLEAARYEIAQIVRDDIGKFAAEFFKEFGSKYERAKKRLRFLDDPKGDSNGNTDRFSDRMPLRHAGAALAPV